MGLDDIGEKIKKITRKAVIGVAAVSPLVSDPAPTQAQVVGESWSSSERTNQKIVFEQSGHSLSDMRQKAVDAIQEQGENQVNFIVGTSGESTSEAQERFRKRLMERRIYPAGDDNFGGLFQLTDKQLDDLNHNQDAQKALRAFMQIPDHYGLLLHDTTLCFLEKEGGRPSIVFCVEALQKPLSAFGRFEPDIFVYSHDGKKTEINLAYLGTLSIKKTPSSNIFDILDRPATNTSDEMIFRIADPIAMEIIAQHLLNNESGVKGRTRVFVTKPIIPLKSNNGPTPGEMVSQAIGGGF